MKTVIPILALALLGLVHGKPEADPFGLKGKPFSWSYCDESADYQLHIDTFKVSPDPPKRGSKVKLQAKGTLKGEITKGAKLRYTVKLGLLQLAKKTIDLCDALAGIKDKQVPKCPVQAGEFELSREEDFPGEAPAGKYTIEAEAVGADGKSILCVKGELSLPLLND